MPTVDVSSARVRSQSINTVKLPAGAFQAEFRALEQSGRATSALGGTIATIGNKLQSASDARSMNAALLKAQQYDDTFSADMLKDTDYATQAERYTQGFDAATLGLDEDLSPRAQQELRNRLSLRKSRGSTRAKADAHLNLAREERANAALHDQRSVDDESNEASDKMRQLFRNEYKANLNRLEANGQLAATGRWSREGRWRNRTMTKAQSFSARRPGEMALVLESKASMAESGLFDDTEIDSLTDEDVRTLLENAQREDAFEQLQRRTRQQDAKAKLEVEQRKTANAAYAKATPDTQTGEPGDLAGAIGDVRRAPYDAEWKIAQIDKLKKGVEQLEKEPDNNPWLKDGSPEKKAELTSMRWTGSLTQTELDEWHGRTDGISTSTYNALSKEIAQSPEETSVGLKQRFADLKNLQSVPSATKATKQAAAQLATRLGLSGAQATEVIGLAGITSKQFQVGSQALTTWAEQHPDDTNDANKVDAAWSEVVLPAMFDTPDEDTGLTWWDRMWAGQSLRSAPPGFTGQAFGTFGPSSVPGAPVFERTATNPETGKQVGWDGSKWVEIK